jgi:phosphotransacetylase
VAGGPILLGARRPVHVIQYGAPAEAVVNLATIGALQVAQMKAREHGSPAGREEAAGRG